MVVVEGYDVEVLQEISSDLYCVICLKLMRNPVQFKCGHGMCYVCFKSLLHRSSQRSSTQCPQCREIVKEGQIVSNVMLHRLILSLNVKCTNQEHGCKWSGELDRFEDHFNQCTKTPENPSNNKKSRKKKAKKETAHRDTEYAQTIHNELLLQITEQLSKLNDSFYRMPTNGELKENQPVESPFTHVHTFIESVTATRKTKFLALVLFTISLLTGMQLLTNPWWGSSSGKTEPVMETLQKNYQQVHAELSKINSLIYAQQNNFFQLHLGSKELQSELENQKKSFMRFLGLYMRNTLHGAHFKKTSISDHVDRVFNNEITTMGDLGQTLIHQFGKVKDHGYGKLSEMQNQTLDAWLFHKASKEELMITMKSLCEGAQRDLTQTLAIAHTASQHAIGNAFKNVRKELKAFQDKLNDFDGFSYADIKEHLVKEFAQTDAVLSEKLDQKAEENMLNLLSTEYKSIEANIAKLTNRTLQEFQHESSYLYQFQRNMAALSNVNTENGHYIWKMNTSMLPLLPEGHGYYSEPFTAITARSPIEPLRFAKLWIVRISAEKESWNITYEQDSHTPVVLSVSIVNQVYEGNLPCKETYREESTDDNDERLVVDFSMPLNTTDLANEGFIKDENIYIRCHVHRKD